MQETSATTLSVVITTKNEEETIGECLRLILAAPPKQKEVIVVYGKSEDRTEEIIRQFDTIKIIEDNQGTGSAINTGILNSTGEIIFYVEGHSFITKNIFQQTLHAFSIHPMVGYATFKRYIPNNMKWNPIQRLVNAWRGNIKDSTMGQFRVFRRPCFFDVGGFWTFPKLADDLEFGTRLFRTKWKHKVLTAKCWDWPPRTTLTQFLKKEYLAGKGYYLWFRQYHDHPYFLVEFGLEWATSLLMARLLYRMILKRAFLSPFYALRMVLRKRAPWGFVPFYTIMRWCQVIGFFFGFTWTGKEQWDSRIVKT